MAKPKQYLKLALESILKALASDDENYQVKMEEVKTDAGAVLFAESFEVGIPIFIIEADQQIPLPVGEYMLEDGRKLTVTEEGIIGAIAEAAAPENPELETEKPLAPEKKMYSVEDIKALIDAGLSKEKEDHEAKVKALETKLSELETKLAVEPEGVKPNPEGRKPENVKLGKKNISPVEKVFELMQS